MGGLAAPFLNHLGHCLAAYLFPAVHDTFCCVQAREGPHGIDRCYQPCRAKGRHHLTTEGMVHYRLGKYPGSFFEGFGIGYGVSTLATLIHNYGLKPLASHNRT